MFIKDKTTKLSQNQLCFQCCKKKQPVAILDMHTLAHEVTTFYLYSTEIRDGRVPKSSIGIGPILALLLSYGVLVGAFDTSHRHLWQKYIEH